MVAVRFWRASVLDFAMVEETVKASLGACGVVQMILGVGAYLVLSSVCRWFPRLIGFLGLSAVDYCPGVVGWSLGLLLQVL